MWARVAGVLVVLALTSGATPTTAAAQTPQASAPEASDAQRCFEHHKFGATPVDVAKTADGQTVLAQVSWGYHDAIGCYLTLDEQALAALRAAGPPPSLPDAPTDASPRCFEHHQFGATPVDVAKTADGQTVLARLSWGHHPAIGCYLVLDNTALTTLRAAAVPDNGYTAISVSGLWVCAIAADQTIDCWEGAPGREWRYFDDRHPYYDDRNAHFHFLPSEEQFTAVAGTCFIAVDETIRCLWSPHTEKSGPDGFLAPPDGRYTAISWGNGIGSFNNWCAIAVDGPIDCWGSHGFVKINAPEGQYTALAVSGPFPCAIAVDGTIDCWNVGDNSSTRTLDMDHVYDTARAAYDAAVQDGAASDAARAVYNEAWSDAFDAAFNAAVAAGEPNEAFYCLKQEWNGTKGRWDVSCHARLPGKVLDGQYTAIDAASSTGGCAIAVDGTIDCWELDFSGTRIAPCGLRIQGVWIPCSPEGRYSWEGTPPDGWHTAIAIHGPFGCAIAVDGTIDCWGYNSGGQTIAPDGRYTAISTGDGDGSYGFTCAIAVDGTINCWGGVGRGAVPSGWRLVAPRTAHG